MDDPMDATRAARAADKRVRRQFGLKCPVCRKERPRGCPTLLLGHKQCRADGYIDPRPFLTTEQYLEILDD
jgi:hypothetical protein